jgi:hypothetical protein
MPKARRDNHPSSIAANHALGTTLTTSRPNDNGQTQYDSLGFTNRDDNPYKPASY